MILPSSDSAQTGPAAMRQLVNLDCALCGVRITCDADAEFCGSCHQPVHLRCKDPPSADSEACGHCGAPRGPAQSDESTGLHSDHGLDESAGTESAAGL